MRLFVSCAGGGLAVALLAAAAAPLVAPRSPDANWNLEAAAAARATVAAAQAPPDADVRFADVKVRGNGDENARSVCGSFAVWSDEGTLGPYRDFWVAVTKRPGTRAEIQAVEPRDIPQDAFLDRESAYFLHCFGGDG